MSDNGFASGSVHHLADFGSGQFDIIAPRPRLNRTAGNLDSRDLEEVLRPNLRGHAISARTSLSGLRSLIFYASCIPKARRPHQHDRININIDFSRRTPGPTKMVKPNTSLMIYKRRSTNYCSADSPEEGLGNRENRFRAYPSGSFCRGASIEKGSKNEPPTLSATAHRLCRWSRSVRRFSR